MPTINDLSSVSAISDSDQIPLFAAGSQTTRRATVGQLRETIQEGLTVEDGVLGISSFYVLRGTGLTAPFALTTTPAPFNATAYTGSFTLPADRGSMQADPANGRFIALRDISAFEFTVGITGDWPAGTTITMALQCGDPGNLFTSAFQWSMLGVGPGLVLSGTYGGPASNLNDTLGILRAGQIIRVVASLTAPGTLNMTRIAFAVRTLDGQ